MELTGKQIQFLLGMLESVPVRGTENMETAIVLREQFRRLLQPAPVAQPDASQEEDIKHTALETG